VLRGHRPAVRLRRRQSHHLREPLRSSLAGVAFEFYSGGPYPTAYDGALFFADYSRDCVWAMFRGGNNLPNPASVINFVMPAANPVDLQISPAGELFYADFTRRRGR
jgi:hypothetical protein